MNARSGSQVVEVVQAALRRAGLRNDWFLRPPDDEASQLFRDTLERHEAASASLMNAVASQPSNDQVIVLLLALQNQLAGQWQAISALSASVIQLRQVIGAQGSVRPEHEGRMDAVREVQHQRDLEPAQQQQNRTESAS